MESGTISAIIPTIGRAESLRRLLDSLAAQSRQPDEVIIADGSCGEEVRRVVEHAEWAERGLPVRRVVVRPPNAVSQRRAAIAQSRGEYLLFLDDDVVLDRECVTEMRLTIEDAADMVAVIADFSNQSWPGPTTVWRWYLRWCCGVREGQWQGQVIGPLLRFGYVPSPVQPMPMQWIGTGNSLVRRAAYEQVGGFSDLFLRRCTMNEDVDLGLKLGRVGRMVICPAARLAHMQAPGGRLPTAAVAEDDLYNRYLILRRTQNRRRMSAFGLVVLYFVVETSSNLAGCLRRLQANEFGLRLLGRLRALGRILCGPFPAL